MQEAKIKEQERRDASWAGRQGQAERAALAEMSSSVQGRNAAEYAARRESDVLLPGVSVDLIWYQLGGPCQCSGVGFFVLPRSCEAHNPSLIEVLRPPSVLGVHGELADLKTTPRHFFIKVVMRSKPYYKVVVDLVVL